MVGGRSCSVKSDAELRGRYNPIRARSNEPLRLR
jgi:hypothetical protein